MSLPDPVPLLTGSGIPCVFVSFESAFFAAFTPFKLKTGQNTDPKDVLFLYDPDKSFNIPDTEEPDVVMDLFEGPLDTFIENLKLVFRIQGDLDLEILDLELNISEVCIHVFLL